MIKKNSKRIDSFFSCQGTSTDNQELVSNDQGKSEIDTQPPDTPSSEPSKKIVVLIPQSTEHCCRERI